MCIVDFLQSGVEKLQALLRIEPTTLDHHRFHLDTEALMWLFNITARVFATLQSNNSVPTKNTFNFVYHHYLIFMFCFLVLDLIYTS